MNKFRLHPLFDGEGAIGAESGVEVVPAAGEQATTQVENTSETGANAEVAADPEKLNNYEKAFAKRLAAKEAEWEAKNAEKYKDYDTLKDTAEFFRERHGFNDLLSMKEDIELAKLQDKAAANNISPEMQKRLETLEAKAAKSDEYEQQQEQAKTLQEFESGLKEFAKDKQIDGKPVDHMELWKFMHENGISKPEAAFKAMKADILEKQMETVKQDTIKEYLDSKKGPKVEGAPGTASVQAVDTRKMTWDQLDKHVLERVKAASTPQ